jgi:O-antigen/teichoic acid export membrane protein
MTVATDARAVPRRMAILQRLSWGLADQAVTSMVSFAVGVYVAKSLHTDEFGAFSLAWVTYGVALNINRGLGADPLAVRFSGVQPSLWRGAVARSTGLGVTVGLLAGLTCILAGLALGERPGPAFIALGVVLPGLLLQDSWRFAFFAAGQGGRAMISDLAWAAALVPLLLLAHREPNVVRYILAWGAASLIAALVSAMQVRIRPRPTLARAWLTEHRDLGPRYLIENVSLSGAAQLRAYALGAIAGLAAVGTVRGAELLLGPFLLIMSGVGLVAVPEAARVLKRSVRLLPAFCLILGLVQAAAALVWGLFLLLALPHQAGHMLLGEVWDTAQALVLPETIAVMCASMSTGAAAGLRALGRARRSLRAQLLASGLYLGFGVAGAVAGGAAGSAWGVAVATFVGAVAWWWYLRAAVRDADHPDYQSPPTEPRRD